MKCKIGVAPDSWGVIFKEDDKQMAWDRVLDEMAQAGYEGIELGPWGFFPNTIETLTPELAKRNLDLVAATLPVNPITEENLKATLATVDDIGKLLNSFPDARYLVMLPDKIAPENWDAYCDGCQKIYEYALEKYNIIAMMHPHMWCDIETEEQIERFLNQTTVPLCLDTGHHVLAGGDALAFYKKWSARIPYMHFKDCNPVMREKMLKGEIDPRKAIATGLMCAPGDGMIDWNAFRQAMIDANYEGWGTVEQDCYPCAPEFPLPTATRTRNILRDLKIG